MKIGLRIQIRIQFLAWLGLEKEIDIDRGFTEPRSHLSGVVFLGHRARLRHANADLLSEFLDFAQPDPRLIAHGSQRWIILTESFIDRSKVRFEEFAPNDNGQADENARNTHHFYICKNQRDFLGDMKKYIFTEQDEEEEREAFIDGISICGSETTVERCRFESDIESRACTNNPILY